TTNSSGIALFSNLPVNSNFTFEAVKPTSEVPGQSEYWGYIENVNSGSNQTVARDLPRNAAYATTFTGNNVTTNSGESKQIRVTVRNGEPNPRTVEVNLQVTDNWSTK